jgi:hypothetical protein
LCSGLPVANVDRWLIGVCHQQGSQLATAGHLSRELTCPNRTHCLVKRSDRSCLFSRFADRRAPIKRRSRLALPAAPDLDRSRHPANEDDLALIAVATPKAKLLTGGVKHFQKGAINRDRSNFRACRPSKSPDRRRPSPVRDGTGPSKTGLETSQSTKGSDHIFHDL